MTLALSCEVVHKKLWKSVNICKSYSKKISGTFFSWTRCRLPRRIVCAADARSKFLFSQVRPGQPYTERTKLDHSSSHEEHRTPDKELKMWWYHVGHVECGQLDTIETIAELSRLCRSFRAGRCRSSGRPCRMLLDRTILTTADWYEVVYDLSSGAIFNDSEWFLIQISRVRLRWIS